MKEKDLAWPVWFLFLTVDRHIKHQMDPKREELATHGCGIMTDLSGKRTARELCKGREGRKKAPCVQRHRREGALGKPRLVVPATAQRR